MRNKRAFSIDSSLSAISFGGMSSVSFKRVNLNQD